MTELEQAIAEILDYPSVFMGGPSRQSLRKAEAIVAMLKERIATGQLVPAQVWTTETNTLPWAFLTIGQMRAFEQSQGELERLGLNGEWIATDTPLSPGLVYRTKPAAPPAEGV